jgi:hypothetical protein
LRHARWHNRFNIETIAIFCPYQEIRSCVSSCNLRFNFFDYTVAPQKHFMKYQLKNRGKVLVVTPGSDTLTKSFLMIRRVSLEEPIQRAPDLTGYGASRLIQIVKSCDQIFRASQQCSLSFVKNAGHRPSQLTSSSSSSRGQVRIMSGVAAHGNGSAVTTALPLGVNPVSPAIPSAHPGILGIYRYVSGDRCGIAAILARVIGLERFMMLTVATDTPHRTCSCPARGIKSG